MKKYLITILVLAVLFRTVNLESIPHWYWDEGLNMNMSWNIINGHMRLFNLDFSFIPHPPLYFIISGIMLKLFGNDILTLRIISALYGIMTIVFLYFIGKELFDEKMGILGGFIYSIYPGALYWGRMALGNNQFIFLSTITFLFFIRYLKEKNKLWFYLMCIFSGLAIITEITGITIILSITILLLLYDTRRQSLKYIILSMLLFIFYLVFMMTFIPDIFLQDLRFQFFRFNGIILIISTVIVIPFLFCFKDKIKKLYDQLLVNNIMNHYIILFYLLMSYVILKESISDYWFYMGKDYFLILGLLGIFYIENDKVRNIILTFFLILLGAILISGRSDHVLMPLYPYLGLCSAIFLMKAFNYAKAHATILIATLLIFHPLVIVMYQDFSTFILQNNIIKEPVEDNLRVSKFVNENSDINDVILVPAQIAHLFKAKTTTVLESISIENRQIIYHPEKYSTERFNFNSSYKNSRFIVLNKELPLWMQKEPEIIRIVNEIKNWPSIIVGNYIVYKNPKK